MRRRTLDPPPASVARVVVECLNRWAHEDLNPFERYEWRSTDVAPAGFRRSVENVVPLAALAGCK